MAAFANPEYDGTTNVRFVMEQLEAAATSLRIARLSSWAKKVKLCNSAATAIETATMTIPRLTLHENERRDIEVTAAQLTLSLKEICADR